MHKKWRERKDSIRRTNPYDTASGTVAEAKGFDSKNESVRYGFWNRGGSERIRTFESLATPHDFESCAFNHSATLPPIIISQNPPKLSLPFKSMCYNKLMLRPHTHKSLLVVLFLVSLTSLSALILSSSFASADDNTVVIDDINITIPTACSIQGTGNNSHNATINNGTYVSDIGTTTIKAFCNDSEGFAIYAIGYTDNEYGKNVMTSDLGSTYNIVTGTGTSGNSQWAMKLATESNATYPITIQNGFNAYHTVPNEHQLVASRSARTDVGNNAEGSTLTSTYQVFISGTQPAGTYVGQVLYTMVNPSSADPPLSPKQPTPGKISYWPNANIPDAMGDQTVDSSAASVELWASNFQRQGYGFAGWSTTFDYSGDILGPNETIDDADLLATIQSEGLSLYAYWIPSAGSLQGWNGCSNMSVGDVTALTDLRDNDTYAVAKLADEQCWMIENLRLDYDAAHNTDGSLAQGYGGQFAGLALPETDTFSNVTTANSLYYSGIQSGTASIDIGTTNNPDCRFPRYHNNNTNTDITVNPNTTVANMTSGGENVYSYGNYYSWPAALANTNYYDSLTATDSNGKTSETANTSICPSGWRLPYALTYGNGNTPGGFYYLNYRLNNNSNITNATSSNIFRSYPNNFVLSGYPTNITTTEGYYWSSTNSTYYGSSAYNFSITKKSISVSSYDYKYKGKSIRCVSDPPENET